MLFLLQLRWAVRQRRTSVDLAKRSLEKTKEQFAINGFDPEKQKIHVMDVFGYFKYAKKKELTFDMIILDPPKALPATRKKSFLSQKIMVNWLRIVWRL